MTHTTSALQRACQIPGLLVASRIVFGALVVAALSPTGHAGTAVKGAAPVSEATAPPAVQRPASKDVVLDSPAAAPAQAPGGPSPQRQLVLAAAMGDLGSLLLSGDPDAPQSPGSGNAVVSPLSVAAALGLLQTGAKGQTAQELTYVLDSGSSRGQRLTEDLPALLHSLQGGKGQAAESPLQVANRVWVDQRVAEKIAPAFVSKAKQRWGADGALVPFAQAEPTRALINQWVATQTRQQIKEILPSGSVSGNTRFVITNAVHFKSAWQEPFDSKQTQPRPFKLEGKAPVSVPTLQDERPVRQARLAGGETVYELPFKGGAYAMVMVLPAPGTPLKALESSFRGADWAAHAARLEPQNCLFQVPKFKLGAAASSLKATLRSAGVQQAFGNGADFSELLGKKADAKLDDVFHAASFEIDEAGGEASAATAAVAVAKGFAAPVPECTVDRPFVFALVHKASGAPLFVGRVTDPSQP